MRHYQLKEKEKRCPQLTIQPYCLDIGVKISDLHPQAHKCAAVLYGIQMYKIPSFSCPGIAGTNCVL